ncbi:MAG: mechanosensitive ion channel [Bacteroidales bacterium]|nr:mechanosensitive ion channel [Bacteroidales bacterium]
MKILTIGNDINKWLTDLGINAELADSVTILMIFIGLAIVAWLVDFLSKKIILTIISQFVKKSKTNWDDILMKRKFFNKIAHLAPAFVIYYLIGWALDGYPGWTKVMMIVTNSYIVLNVVWIFNSFMNGVNDIYDARPTSKGKSIKSYIQVLQILAYLVGIILIISIIIDKSPGFLLGGLGAFAAILILVFQDSIKGLVAGIQLSGNDMVRVGDWISMPSHNADGTVIEITLNTVKIQNWDKTIATVPTYELVAKSFSNWRGMEESGGRRIARSINLDMKSVKFCSTEMIEKFKRFHSISKYINDKVTEIEEYNKSLNLDSGITANGRRLTNLGVFRKYLEAYLRNNPNVNLEMTFLVRQLEPSEKGIPIQLYVFSKIQSWAEYEAVQSDIFDHILAIIPEFELNVFQNPSGSDFQKLICD